MRTKLCFTILAAAILGLFMAVSLAGAETMKMRVCWHIIKAEVVPVGDVAGHVIGVVDIGGLASFDSGEIATHSHKATIDYINGSGLHENYMIYTFEDGSTFVTKGQGTTTADPGRKISLFKGSFSFIQGSGRFAGIQGSGSYTGKRFAPAAAGAEAYIDCTATYTLPPR